MSDLHEHGASGNGPTEGLVGPRPPTAGSQPPSGLTRRQFLQAAAASAVGAVVFVGCQAPPRELEAQSRVRLAEDVLAAYENWYASTCRQCAAGCGMIVRVIEGRAKKVEGNPDHPLNRGKLCARGQATVQEQYHPDRVQGPLRRSGDRGSGAFSPISWDEALNELVGRLRQLQQQGQSGQVALLTRSLRSFQRLLVERFATAYGAQWLRLDPLGEAPFRQAVRRVFGQDWLPEFDVQNARYVLSFGADFLATWLSPVHYGVHYGVFRQGSYELGRFEPRHEQGRPRGYLVQVDSRFSPTAANADEWVWVRPGREGLLALGIAQVIASEGLGDPAGVRALGGAAALDEFQPERIAQETGVPAERIRQLARDFAGRRPSLALAGGPAGAQTNGADNVAAALALNLLVGNVGQPGGVRLNAPPPIPGLPPSAEASRLADWQALADRLRAGQVQAALVYDANPAYGLPAALGFREALLQAPYVVSFSSFLDETTALADLVLPAHLPLEDWGADVPDPGPGIPVLTLQQPVLRPFYDTRSFWDVLLLLAGELGGPVQQALPWRTFKDAIREGVRPLQPANRGNVREADFEAFWTRLLERGGWWDEAAPAPAAGAPDLGGLPAAVRRAEFAGAEQEYPFHLAVFPQNTLGDGRSAHLPWLQATPDPITSVVWQTWVELNPRRAAELGIVEGDVVALESPQGRIEVPVYIHPAAPPDVLAVPMGQGHAGYGRWAQGRGGNPLAVLAPLADQTSGALAYGATRVRLTKTGRRVAVAKFEGTVPAFQLPHEEVLQVTSEA